MKHPKDNNGGSLSLRLDEDDNVALCLTDISSGQEIEAGLVAKQDISAGHKVAISAIRAQDPIIKYNQVIGIANRSIDAGEHVHVHNMVMPETTRPTKNNPQRYCPTSIRASFQGYKRANGKSGTRNYIAILTSVNCSATVAKAIADQYPRSRFIDESNIDGVVAFTHTGGCGSATHGEGPETLRRTVAGYLNQANFAGVLLIGLGCEANQISAILDHANLQTGARLCTLSIQQAGGTREAIEQGCNMVDDLIKQAKQDRRTEISASELTLGLQCGGSDGWSGITANPALGRAADKLVAAGGTIILSETPEIYGAEQLLFNRAINQSVVSDLQARLDWWQDYLHRNNAEVNNNPSPGNLKGGISTIVEKSLGAVAKSGRTSLNAVYHYAQAITEKGFVFMDSPGYDPCSATGQMASGANLLAFTTGRGSVYGSKPAPCIKLASNAALAQHMNEDIDVDCSDVLQTATLEQKGQEIFDLLLAVASGKQSKSEALGIGDLEFVPWQIGAVV